MSVRSILLNKKVLVLIALVIIAVVVASAYKSCSEEKGVSYRFAPVELGDVQRTVNVNGSLELFSVDLIRSEVEGQVSKIHKDYNEYVVAGDLLLEIFSESIVESYEQYVDTYRFARIDLQNSRDLFLTKKKLFEEELISSSEYENSRLSYQKEISSFKRVEKTYLEKKELLDSRMVRAVNAGLIIDCPIKVGDDVATRTLLYRIAPTMEKMILTINIDESDVGIVKKGQKVTFTVSAYPEDIFHGEIDQVTMNPTTIDSIVTYQTTAIVNNKNNSLKPGMTAAATIHVASAKNVLRVPNQAFMVTPQEIETKPGEKVLWKKISSAVDQIPVTPVHIKTGVAGDTYTEIITDKIKKGDEILTGISIER